MGNDEMMTEYYIWLQFVLGAGNSHALKILDRFKNAQNVYNSDISELKLSGLFTEKELERVKSVKLGTAYSVIRKCEKSGIEIFCIDDTEYPMCLRSISNPPLAIFVKGNMPNFDDTPSVCIVGPRSVSGYGKRAAFSLSSRLSRAGMIIVSGGALGCDTYVHTGALKYGGVTVAVLGCGINYNYLPDNAKLREQICNKGCLISEYPPDAPSRGYNFPVRNRIMSALSLGTVVVEAGSKSGALITAAHANEQGRDVFVIPGLPGDPHYIGSNALLRDGARPLLDTSDIFNEYIPRFPDKINIENAFRKQDKKINKKIINSGLSKTAQIVYNQLDKQKFYPDELIDDKISAGDLISALTELEIEGIIRAVPGGMYELV